MNREEFLKNPVHKLCFEPRTLSTSDKRSNHLATVALYRGGRVVKSHKIGPLVEIVEMILTLRYLHHLLTTSKVEPDIEEAIL